MLQLILPADVQTALTRALRHAGVRECGGLLLGEHVGIDQFAVRMVNVQRPGTVASFVRSLSGVAASIKRFCAKQGNDFRRFNYLGEWHSHPSFSVQPSSTDHGSMLDIVTNRQVQANFVVLLILKLNTSGQLEGSAHTYLPDGRFGHSTLVFESCR